MQRQQQLFAAALELPEAMRAVFLRAECGDDGALLERLMKLLNVDARLRNMTARTPVAGIDALVSQLAPGASLVGSQVGAYRLCESLGQGGMGNVYRAERDDGAVVQQVAIKFVRRELLDANTLRRFQLERQTLATLDHAHVARLIDAAELADGTPYFVMDYVAGSPITEYCRRAQLGLRARLLLFRDVCAAVSHAHRNLIVHRDLKPGNILVNHQGVVKLLDFGIAKSLETPNSAIAELTATAQRFFSPRYAAPEQLLGGPIGVGCDVYALGLLLFELIAGTTPFDLEGLSAGQIERLITTVPPAAPSARTQVGADHPIAAQQLRGDLDGLVLRCLRKAPAERYASVERLEDDLNRYLDGRPLQARSGQWLYRLRKFVGRHRLSTAVVTLATLALALAMFALLAQNAALKSERDLSQQSLRILKDSFAAADPIRSSGADIRASQILDAARQRVDATFAERPDLFIALSETIAEVDLSLGRASEAAGLMQRATEAATRLDSASPTRQRLLILYAQALISADRLVEAHQQLELGRRLSRDAPVEWMIAKGRLLALQRNGAAAIALLGQSVAMLANAPPTSEIANSARLTLAEAHRVSDDYPAALRVLDDTLRWQRAGLPESHPQITRTRLRRVAPLRESGHAQESLKEAQSIVAEIERVYGTESAESAFAQTALARSLDALGRGDEALTAYRLALRHWQRTLGADHHNTLRAAFNLAYTLQLDARTAAEAEALYRQLLDLATRRAGPNDEMVVYYRLYFGKFLQSQGRTREAFDILAIANGGPGLRTSSAENRDHYLGIMATLYSALGCAGPTGQAPQPQCGWAGDLLAQQTSNPAATDAH